MPLVLFSPIGVLDLLPFPPPHPSTPAVLWGGKADSFGTLSPALLLAHFGQFGEIEEVPVMRERGSRAPRGFGFGMASRAGRVYYVMRALGRIVLITGMLSLGICRGFGNVIISRTD